MEGLKENMDIVNNKDIKHFGEIHTMNKNLNLI